jgi:hypothetical protein
MFSLIHDFTRFRLDYRRFAADERGVILPLVPPPFDRPCGFVARDSALSGSPERGRRLRFGRGGGTGRRNASPSGLNDITFPTTKTPITGEDLSSSGS